ncbi:MAG: YggS family pyridoxal phosphate-dependent enzyme [Patescibacteria group bacterium]
MITIPPHVQCIAAVKYADHDSIEKIIAEGFANLGWSTVQHFLKTIPLFKQQGLEHHFIGHLQSNKVEELLSHEIALIHSVDSEKLLFKINTTAEQKNKVQKILLQVKTDPEKEFGFSPEEIQKKLSEWKKLSGVGILGLMTIPPAVKNPEENREMFRTMKKLADSLRLAELSMGMSDDYEIAIEEGATMIRLGRILFEKNPENSTHNK